MGVRRVIYYCMLLSRRHCFSCGRCNGSKKLRKSSLLSGENKKWQMVVGRCFRSGKVRFHPSCSRAASWQERIHPSALQAAAQSALQRHFRSMQQPQRVLSTESDRDRLLAQTPLSSTYSLLLIHSTVTARGARLRKQSRRCALRLSK